MRLEIFAGWLVVLALGCGGPAAGMTGGVTEPRAARSDAAVSEESAGGTVGARPFLGGFRSIEAIGQGLKFPLPDAQGWRRDPRDKQSWVARHRRTTSTLVVRAWDYEDIARREDCERQARSWRPELPEAAQEELLEEREQVLAGGYQARIVLFVRSASPAAGGAIEGYALAFGSDARSCLMMAFSTVASGARASDDIAERLSVVAEGVFGRARRVGIGERVVVPRM